jgi:hypothetical protein
VTGAFLPEHPVIADSGEPLVDAEFIAAIEAAADLTEFCQSPVRPPMEFDPPDPDADGRLAYPDYDAATTRVVSYPRRDMSEEDAWGVVHANYTGRVLGSLHTASRWAWRVRAAPYKEVR